MSLCLLNSCKDKDDEVNPRTRTSDNEYVNEWIYENMSDYYLWTDHIPANADLNFKSDPEDFFESVLYPYNTVTAEGDRFSWIQKNYVDLLNSLSGVSRDKGFEYIATYADDTQTSVNFLVLYVKPGTTAESNGLTRGDFIVSVDGSPITENNYRNILSSGKNSYTLSVYDPATIKTKNITISVHENYAENPIYTTQIYEKAGKKIGYICYNQFTPDKGDNSYKYDIELINIFSNFKTEGVTDVVLDLRYNGGGYISCAINIASALVPDRTAKKIFTENRYNKQLQTAYVKQYGEDYLKDFFVDKLATGRSSSYSIPSLALPKLYVLVSKNTASASELVINGLTPYMDVVLIGEKTYGKNVASITIYEEDDSRNKWGMQPIIAQLYNASGNSDYAKGFIPEEQYTVNEFLDSGIDKLKPLGDENETMLSIAIAAITGSPLPKIKSAGSPLKTIGSSFDKKPGAFNMFIDNKNLGRNAEE